MIRIEQNLSHMSDDQLRVLLCEDARDVLFIQDACNLSGVVFSWARAMDLICELAHRGGHGTDWKNTHPVNVLFASKVANLTNCEQEFHGAYTACKELEVHV